MVVCDEEISKPCLPYHQLMVKLYRHSIMQEFHAIFVLELPTEFQHSASVVPIYCTFQTLHYNAHRLLINIHKQVSVILKKSTIRDQHNAISKITID